MTNTEKTLETEKELVGMKTMTGAEFLDYWIKNSVEIDFNTTTRLTGEDSLYETYKKACWEQGQPPPMTLRAFTKRLEIFFEWHFKMPITKTRDQKGMRYPGVKLKPTLSHASQKKLEVKEDQLVGVS